MLSCIVLCGGQGTRIAAHLPPGTPKCMADINGRPFLHRLLEHLHASGVRQFVLATSCLVDGIQVPPDWPRGSVWRSKQAFQLGTAHAVRFAMDEYGMQAALVVNGDTVCWCDYERLCSSLPSKAVTLGGIDAGAYALQREDIWNSDEDLANDTLPRLQLQLRLAATFLDIGTPEGLSKARKAL